jgi:hypothetical protein
MLNCAQPTATLDRSRMIVFGKASASEGIAAFGKRARLDAAAPRDRNN